MIVFDDVGYTYPVKGSKAAKPALKGISTTLEAGSFHFLTGASGAGKTTMFRLLHLDLLPSEGRLLMFNRSVGALSRDERALMRRKLGVVFQDFRLLDHLTVRENVELPLALHGKPTEAEQQAVDEMLAWVGLGDKKHLTPDRLSGGEMQRVAVARAVVNKPEILIADEPTGNVDAAMGKRIMHLLVELNKHCTTVLVATHDPNLLKNFKYPVLEMKDGKLEKQAARHDDKGEDA